MEESSRPKRLSRQMRCQYYSVPYEYIGKTVEIRITKDTVEIIYENMRVCSHKKNESCREKYITEPSHMPQTHRKHGEWNADRFRNRASKIGRNTTAVIEYLLTSTKVEQQSYKTCNALLHLADKYSDERLESACHRVLGFTPRPNFKAVNSILKSGQDNLLHDAKTEQRDESISLHGFIRGADYYGGDNDDE